VLVGIIAVGAAGCDASDPDERIRAEWRARQTTEHNAYLRDFLNGNGDMQFYDGWYDIEGDPDSGAGWRWMGKRAIVRLRTKPEGRTQVTDMVLTVHGWVPWEHLGFRTSHLEFAINGHVLDKFEPPRESFERAIFVPRFLLEQSEWVDFAITVANTARPQGDWRDLGMGTSGFVWKPAPGN
jgi:hypothetical protein